MVLGRPVSLTEVGYVVNKMEKEKPPGPDGIPVEVLQEMMH